MINFATGRSTSSNFRLSAGPSRKPASPMVLYITLLSFLFGSISSTAFSDTYNWTDNNGVVNFTDDPSRVPKRYRRNVPAETQKPAPAVSDIVGSWSNEQNEFKTLNCVFRQDQSGVLITAIGMAVPFRWQLLNGGTIEMMFTEESGPTRSGKARAKESRVIRADYIKEAESIQIRGEDKTLTTLYRLEDAEYKAKKRSEFKQKRMYMTDRLVFSDLTVFDTVTGLIWTRDGSLVPNGEVLTFSYAKRFIEDLNKQKYGGYDDWRFPTLKELQDLARFGKGFYHESSPSANRKNWGVASVFNGMGFVDVKPFFYWTSTIHSEFKGYPYCVSLTDGSDTFNIDYYTRHVWPVRGGKK